MSANDPSSTCAAGSAAAVSILRSFGLHFIGMQSRAGNWLFRCFCRDDPVGLEHPQLQIFQEILRIADEFHVVARRKLKRDSDLFYERHAIICIKTIRWLRILPPTVHDGKHRAILFVADRERKMRLAHRDVIVWHRDDITFYRIPKYGRRDCLRREAEIGLDWFSVRTGRSTQPDIGVGKCDAQSIGAKMVRIERQRDFGTCTQSGGKEK